MAQPTIWNRIVSFVTYAINNPLLPYNPADHDAEFDAAQRTVSEIRTNLGLIQRDDGQLRNGAVGPDSLSAATLALIASNFRPRGLWATATIYAVGDMVEQAGQSYVCAVAHLSGTFVTDHNAGDWVIVNGTDPILFIIATGTANAIIATLSSVTALEEGRSYYIAATAANSSTAPTLNLSNLGAKVIVKNGNQLLVAGDIFGAAFVMHLVYRSNIDKFELLNPASSNLAAQLAASSGSSLVGTIAAGAGAVPTTLQAKTREIVSVTGFYANGVSGAAVDPTGVLDSTLGIQAAHDALGASGGALYFPGKFLIGSITISKQCFLIGQGMFSGGTFIYAKDATSDVFNVTGSSCVIRDMLFDASVTRSAGSYILFDTASSRCTVENVYMLGWFRGVTLNGVSDFTFRRLILINGVPATGVGIVINSGLLVSLDNVLCDNAVGFAPGAGIQIPNCGDVTMIDCTFAHCINGGTIRPGAGQIATSIYATNCFFDNNTTRGLFIAPASVTGTVQRCRFTGCWFGSSGSNSGVVLDTNSVAGTIDGITFVDPECFLNGDKGINIAGANTKRIKILGGKFAQNADSGIAIQLGANNIQIIGATSGPIGGLAGNGAYGIANPSGVTDDLIIADCQLTGNTTAGMQLGATGSRRFAYNNNGFINENSGTSSIANATTSVAVAHGLDVTPDATDFVFNMTAATTNDPGDLYVDTIGSANFTLHCRADPGATGLAFSWRVKHRGI